MSSEQRLYEAIERKDYQKCKRLIEAESDILNKQCNQKYPLFVACGNNQFELVELFLKNGANVNQLDVYEQSALAYAAEEADFRIIKLLIESGANPNTKDINGITPLHVAINRKDEKICNYLLEHGALINVIDNEGRSPLALSILSDYVYMIYRLIEAGADPNTADYNGDTPLIKAIWMTSSSTIDKNEITNICIKLIQAGADVNAKNENGRTALFTAIYENNTSVALLLIQNGASLEVNDPENENFSLLHYACYQGNATLVRMLIEKDFDVNAFSSSGETPIYIAATKGYIDVVSVLVDAGCQVNFIFGNLAISRCTLLQACIYYIPEYKLFKGIVDHLIKAGVNLGVFNCPILNTCLQYNKFDFAKYLLINGAPLTNKPTDVYHEICFYRAFVKRNIEFMRMCIAAGFSLHQLGRWIECYFNRPFIEEDVQKTSGFRAPIRKVKFFELNELTSHNENDFFTQEEEEEAAADFNEDMDSLMRKTDEEIAELLMYDEFYFEKLNTKRKKKEKKDSTEQNELHLARNIYSFFKYHYTNPLSLQELSRIQIRKSMLKIDYKIKDKIENHLVLPKRLKRFLLLNEFNW